MGENVLEYMLTSTTAFPPITIDTQSPGIELFSPENFVLIKPGEQIKVNTYVTFKFPLGKVGIIMDKSSVVTQKHLKVEAGLIDTGYRGNIKIVLRNVGSEIVHIKTGEPIAQMILIDCQVPSLKKVHNISTDTHRGTRGFGQLTKYFL